MSAKNLYMEDGKFKLINDKTLKKELRNCYRLPPQMYRYE